MPGREPDGHGDRGSPEPPTVALKVHEFRLLVRAPETTVCYPWSSSELSVSNAPPG